MIFSQRSPRGPSSEPRDGPDRRVRSGGLGYSRTFRRAKLRVHSRVHGSLAVESLECVRGGFVGRDRAFVWVRDDPEAGSPLIFCFRGQSCFRLEISDFSRIASTQISPQQTVQSANPAGEVKGMLEKRSHGCRSLEQGSCSSKCQLSSASGAQNSASAQTWQTKSPIYLKARNRSESWRWVHRPIASEAQSEWVRSCAEPHGMRLRLHACLPRPGPGSTDFSFGS